MAYTPEQVIEVKRQIIGQTKNLPEEQRKAIAEQINRMSAEELEEFVRQQMAVSGGEQKIAGSGGSQKGIFRMIVDGDIPSKKIDENKDAIAVVSKRAVVKGHILIIPKKPTGDANSVPAGVFSLAKSIGNKMDRKLKCKSVEIQSESAFGESVINVIPVYDKPVSLNSERYEAGDDEMENIYKLLRVVKKQKIERIKMKVKKKEEVLKLKRRIP